MKEKKGSKGKGNEETGKKEGDRDLLYLQNDLEIRDRDPNK